MSDQASFARDPKRAHDERRDFAPAERLPRVVALAAVIGGISALAAWLLLHLIRLFTNLFFFQVLSTRNQSPAANTLGLLVIAVPVVGGLAIGLMARHGSEKIRGHGIPEAIEAILFNKSRMSPKVAILKPISSGIAIGSGGPFGAEGPIIMTGGALGSLVGQFFRITGGERKTLLVAGAVAGMTAVFGTPIAAVMLAVELLLFELRPRSLLPVAVACCVAAAVRPLLLDGGPLFPLHTAVAGLATLGSCVAAGLAAGALSWTVSTTLYKVEDAFGRLPIHWMWWPALGGVVVGIGGWLEPRALGVGYDVIADLLANRLAVGVVLGLIVCKAVMWVVALGSGTSGGVLAPLLMMGAALGVLVGPWLPGGQPALWPLVFMAATLGGMMRAPIMSVMFALELTQDVNALLPLLVASAVAYGFTVVTMPRSILTEKISRRGHHIYREYGIDPLERHVVSEVMTRDVVTIDGEAAIADALRRHFGATQAHRAFPVLVGARFIGMVDRETLADGLRRLGDARVADLFGANVPAMALPAENCRIIATRLAVHGLERLPVVSDPQSRRLVGLIARSDLVKPSLAVGDEEAVHERFLALPLGAARSRFRALTGGGADRGEDA
ncbi:chloride channel protein [Scleromatobacter humisilvae]|uniref:Chloride channel protein n=1 Tax=Scleromatobacter humisilvae TaxID=2897159 RepID=A0A9X1YEV6_9BURK|nr:chloride channel protein [Scleromatobacter humisilvae]MCK9685019.1 chloride channel protein [Scleromatobacter humisilvae]